MPPLTLAEAFHLHRESHLFIRGPDPWKMPRALRKQFRHERTRYRGKHTRWMQEGRARALADYYPL